MTSEQELKAQLSYIDRTMGKKGYFPFFCVFSYKEHNEKSPNPALKYARMAVWFEGGSLRPALFQFVEIKQLCGWHSFGVALKKLCESSRQSWINCQVDGFTGTKWVNDNVQQPPYISAAITLTRGTHRHTLWDTLRLTLSELQWYPFIICTRGLLHALACFTVLSTASLWR